MADLGYTRRDRVRIIPAKKREISEGNRTKARPLSAGVVDPNQVNETHGEKRGHSCLFRAMNSSRDNTMHKSNLRVEAGASVKVGPKPEPTVTLPHTIVVTVKPVNLPLP